VRKALLLAWALGGTIACRDGYDSVGGTGAIAQCGDVSADLVFHLGENGHCYAWYDNPMTWAGAEENCAVTGAHLVTIADARQAEAIRALVPEQPFHIGLVDGWRWITNEPVTYSNWAPGEPSSEGGSSRASQNANGTWFRVSASGTTLASLCEHTAVRTDEGRRYQIYYDATSWEVARARCQSRGGHLATIPSAEDQVSVERLQMYPYWIGATDEAVEGQWEWITGEPFEFENWAPEQPNGGEEQNCLEVLNAGYLWNDRECGYILPYVCEYGG
jgi:hypothetical protein